MESLDILDNLVPHPPAAGRDIGCDRPVEVHNAGGTAPVLILCDHAGRDIPPGLAGLGLSHSELARHIGWDIGAADLARRLADRLNAPALLCHVSRLVVDPNRRPHHPTSILEISDGTFVPGNQNLDTSEIDRRLKGSFWPYHRHIARHIGRKRRGGILPVLIAIHSFTPVLGHFERPWEIGVLWAGDRRLAAPTLAALAADTTLCVGDNQPYSGATDFGYTITFHAQRTGLPHIMFEMRQDAIADGPSARAWADRLAAILQPQLANANLYRSFDKQLG